jgi:hypothetical protein
MHSAAARMITPEPPEAEIMTDTMSSPRKASPADLLYGRDLGGENHQGLFHLL